MKKLLLVAAACAFALGSVAYAEKSTSAKSVNDSLVSSAKKEKAPKAKKEKAPKAKKGKEKSSSTSKAPFVINSEEVVGYYTFDEEIVDNEVVDHSGNEINVYTGAIDGSVLVEGHNGQALDFNGEDEFITLEGDVLDGEGFTVAAWVKPTEWRGWSRVFDFGNTKDGEDIFIGLDATNGQLSLTLQPERMFVAAPAVNKWTHIAATLDENGTVTLYIDGAKAKDMKTSGKVANIAANPNGLYIGCSNWPDPLFKGAMDEILLVKRALSADEIQAVYNGVVVPETAAALVIEDAAETVEVVEE
ncbi:MAG: LamG domain-containing protein [Treponema sp.]|nr:LamG domain-containing protein [Treponema sp.]